MKLLIDSILDLKKLKTKRKIDVLLMAFFAVFVFTVYGCNKENNEPENPEIAVVRTAEELKLLVSKDTLTQQLYENTEMWLTLAFENIKSNSIIRNPEKANELITALESTKGNEKQLENLFAEHFNNLPLVMEYTKKQINLSNQLLEKHPELQQMDGEFREELSAFMSNELLDNNIISLEVNCDNELIAAKAKCRREGIYTTVLGGIAGPWVALGAGVIALFEMDDCFGEAIKAFELCNRLKDLEDKMQ